MGRDSRLGYFLRCDDYEIDEMSLEKFMPINTFRRFVDNTGIDEIYIFKSENI